MKHILFVCTGNICRSPMAEGLFRAAVADRDDFSIASAGVATSDGQLPSIEAVEVLKDLDLDISAQRSLALTGELVDQADYIFVMTTGHLMTLGGRFPQAIEKAFLVREFEALDEGVDFADIPDPIGMGISVYADCRDVIQAAIPSLITFIDQSNENNPTTS